MQAFRLQTSGFSPRSFTGLPRRSFYYSPRKRICSPEKSICDEITQICRQRPLYGYSIIEEIRDLGLIPVRASTIYMVLSKLEKSGFVKSARKEVKKRVRRMYFTTQKGRQAFEKVKKNKIKGAVRGFLKALLE